MKINENDLSPPNVSDVPKSNENKESSRPQKRRFRIIRRIKTSCNPNNDCTRFLLFSQSGPGRCWWPISKVIKKWKNDEFQCDYCFMDSGEMAEEALDWLQSKSRSEARSYFIDQIISKI